MVDMLNAQDCLYHVNLQGLDPEELSQTKAVLRAAAMTYVASAASMILQLLRLLIISGGRRDD